MEKWSTLVLTTCTCIRECSREKMDQRIQFPPTVYCNDSIKIFNQKQFRKHRLFHPPHEYICFHLMQKRKTANEYFLTDLSDKMKHKAKYCCRSGMKWTNVTQLSLQKHAFPLINLKAGCKKKCLPYCWILYEGTMQTWEENASNFRINILQVYVFS